MTNNDVLKSLRYTLNLPNQGMINIFSLVNVTVTKEQMIAWLEPEDNDTYAAMPDVQLASFLNGLIIKNRGARDGQLPEAETRINYNIILRKLKIAFDLKDDDILALFESADFRLGRSELSAFFRRADHKHYRACQEQVIRYFLRGLQLKIRP